MNNVLSIVPLESHSRSPPGTLYTLPFKAYKYAQNQATSFYVNKHIRPNIGLEVSTEQAECHLP